MKIEKLCIYMFAAVYSCLVLSVPDNPNLYTFTIDMVSSIQSFTVVRVVGFNYPYYPNYRLYFREPPPPPLQLNLMATTLTTPTTVCFLERPHPTLEAESDGS